MSRLSISNLLLPVSRKQFKALTAQFRQAAEQAFGSPCRLEIRAMKAVKLTSRSMQDDWLMNAVAAENKRRTVFETDDPDRLTESIWGRAAYVEVGVRPVSEQIARAFAWGHAEFKGLRSRQATFYLQPEGDDSWALSMISGQRLKWIGSGYDSNSRKSAGGLVENWLSRHRSLAVLKGV